jgi:hypothetical protein
MSLKVKMILLIILGFVLSCSSVFLFQRIGWVGWDLYVFIALLFYPVAIAYGRGVMLDIFYSVKEGPYRFFKQTNGRGIRITLKKACNLFLALFTFVFAGWMYGAYTAYQKFVMVHGSLIK